MMVNTELDSNKEKAAKKIGINIGVTYGKKKAFYLPKSKKGKAAITCGVGVIIGLIIFSVVYASLPSNKINLKPQKPRYIAFQAQNTKEASAIASQMQKNVPQTVQESSLQDQLQQIQKAVANSSLSQSKINDLEKQIDSLAKSVQALQESSDAASNSRAKFRSHFGFRGQKH